MRTIRYLIAGAVALSTVANAQKNAAPASNKTSFDRTAIPKAPADPELRLPKWSVSTLPNGARLVVVEKHSLPLIAFTMNFVGGANQLEPADKTGLAQLTSGMMTEGTTSKTGDEISNALQLLGTGGIGFGIGGEGGTVAFQSLTKTFDSTLAILADEVLHPAFPEAALTRRKAQTALGLRQNRDRTAGIANIVFPTLLYTPDHPYARSSSEASVNSITRDDVVAFHDAFFQPARATITVVGDISPAAAKAKVEKALAGWTGGTPATFNYPAVLAPRPTTIYIVDKPGAAQSSFAIGAAGPARDTPDYYALRTMNALFGAELGVVTRLNANIREAHGWSYGVNSNFAFGRGPGAFRAFGDVQTNKTDSALVEFVKELKGITGARPATDDELTAAKAALVARLPSRLGTTAGLSNMVNEIYLNDLPEDYWTRFSNTVNGLSAADLTNASRKYIDPDHLVILIVGDRSKIEAPVRATGIAPVVILDVNGKPIG
jgi:predicted Zn-dependent peptidase